MENEKIIVHADPDLIDVIPSYLQKRQTDIEKINAAIETGDFKTAEVLGHQMKGSGASYGFADITEIGAKIEKMAKESNKEGIINCLAELSSYLKNVEVVN